MSESSPEHQKRGGKWAESEYGDERSFAEKIARSQANEEPEKLASGVK